MRTFLILFAWLLLAPIGDCQESPVSPKDESIAVAAEYLGTLEPPIDLRNAAPQAVYIKEENVWIVLFADQRPVPPPDSDVMVKIDGESGKPLELLGGARKQGYYKYFSVR